MTGTIVAVRAIIIAGLAAAGLLMAGERIYGGGSAGSATTAIDTNAGSEAAAPADTNAGVDLSAYAKERTSTNCSDNCLAPCAASCADPQRLPPLDGAVVERAAFSAEAAPEQPCNCADVNSSVAFNADAETGDGSTSATSALESSNEITAVGASSASGEGFANGGAGFGMVSN